MQQELEKLEKTAKDYDQKIANHAIKTARQRLFERRLKAAKDEEI